MSTTVLEHLIERLRAAAIYNRHDLAAPSVVLWTDGEGLWSRAIPLLSGALPELLVLAPEIADGRTGPSTWLRYQLARGTWDRPPLQAAFKALCKSMFGLDPDKDGIITAVDRLVAGGGVWDQVWMRYCQAHHAFAGVRKALDLAHPKDLLDDANDRLPATNRKQEDALRTAASWGLRRSRGPRR
jgi:hypothetical protein